MYSDTSNDAKYLKKAEKYKLKYLALKNQLGGDIDKTCCICGVDYNMDNFQIPVGLHNTGDTQTEHFMCLLCYYGCEELTCPLCRGPINYDNAPIYDFKTRMPDINNRQQLGRQIQAVQEDRPIHFVPIQPIPPNVRAVILSREYPLNKIRGEIQVVPQDAQTRLDADRRRLEREYATYLRQMQNVQRAQQEQTYLISPRETVQYIPPTTSYARLEEMNFDSMRQIFNARHPPPPPPPYRPLTHAEKIQERRAAAAERFGTGPSKSDKAKMEKIKIQDYEENRRLTDPTVKKIFSNIKETYPKKYAKILFDYIEKARTPDYLQKNFESMERKRQMQRDQELLRETGRAEVNESGFQSEDDHDKSEDEYEEVPRFNAKPNIKKNGYGDY